MSSTEVCNTATTDTKIKGYPHVEYAINIGCRSAVTDYDILHLVNCNELKAGVCREHVLSTLMPLALKLKFILRSIPVLEH